METNYVKEFKKILENEKEINTSVINKCDKGFVTDSLIVVNEIITNLENYIDVLKTEHQLEDMQILLTLKSVIDYLKIYFSNNYVITYVLISIEIHEERNSNTSRACQ